MPNCQSNIHIYIYVYVCGGIYGWALGLVTIPFISNFCSIILLYGRYIISLLKLQSDCLEF